MNNYEVVRAIEFNETERALFSFLRTSDTWIENVPLRLPSNPALKVKEEKRKRHNYGE
ncbi:MAG: hypothetical protein J7J99_05800 [Thermoprotei archaeon]|nr:hypothetical protein [Thermoprotei archaeon]